MSRTDTTITLPKPRSQQAIEAIVSLEKSGDFHSSQQIVAQLVNDTRHTSWTSFAFMFSQKNNHHAAAVIYTLMAKINERNLFLSCIYYKTAAEAYKKENMHARSGILYLKAEEHSLHEKETLFYAALAEFSLISDEEPIAMHDGETIAAAFLRAGLKLSISEKEQDKITAIHYFETALKWALRYITDPRSLYTYRITLAKAYEATGAFENAAIVLLDILKITDIDALNLFHPSQEPYRIQDFHESIAMNFLNAAKKASDAKKLYGLAAEHFSLAGHYCEVEDGVNSMKKMRFYEEQEKYSGRPSFDGRNRMFEALTQADNPALMKRAVNYFHRAADCYHLAGKHGHAAEITHREIPVLTALIPR